MAAQPRKQPVRQHTGRARRNATLDTDSLEDEIHDRPVAKAGDKPYDLHESGTSQRDNEKPLGTPPLDLSRCQRSLLLTLANRKQSVQAPLSGPMAYRECLQ
jgi:hypothetical protein